MAAKTLRFREKNEVSNLGQKLDFPCGFSIAVWPNQGVQLKDRQF